MPYKCQNQQCKHSQKENYLGSLPQDDLCPECMQPLEEVSTELETSQHGLCILLCDASGSMDSIAFPGSKSTRAQLVAENAALGLYDNLSVAKARYALVVVVAFGKTSAIIKDRNGRPFIKSIEDIGKEFSTADQLSAFLCEAITTKAQTTVDRNYTDITKALDLAKEIHDSALNGSLAKWEYSSPISIIHHSFANASGDFKSYPNVRILLYTDGIHSPVDQSPLKNPFQGLGISPLMTCFIGDADNDPEEMIRKGANQVKALATGCPLHFIKPNLPRPGYFLINKPERYASLRGLFRMASGESGFCPSCNPLADQGQKTKGGTGPG